MDVFVKVNGATRKYSVDTQDHSEAREVVYSVIGQEQVESIGSCMAVAVDNTAQIQAA